MDEQRPVFYARRHDFRRVAARHAPNEIFERMWAEIQEPDYFRSAVITLHLYVEYWLDKILERLGNPKATAKTFHHKASRLHKLGALSPEMFGNVSRINKIRNIYAHELALERAESHVRQLLAEMWLDPYFVSNDPDMFSAVSIQTIFLLEATWNNGGKFPKIEYPESDMRKKLLSEGCLRWDECQSLRVEQLSEHERTWTLHCPLCGDGTIERYKDDTPGFRESHMGQCSKCGLTGDGVQLRLETADAVFRERGTSG